MWNISLKWWFAIALFPVVMVLNEVYVNLNWHYSQELLKWFSIGLMSKVFASVLHFCTYLLLVWMYIVILSLNAYPQMIRIFLLMDSSINARGIFGRCQVCLDLCVIGREDIFRRSVWTGFYWIKVGSCGSLLWTWSYIFLPTIHIITIYDEPPASFDTSYIVWVCCSIDMYTLHHISSEYFWKFEMLYKNAICTGSFHVCKLCCIAVL
jgi:hypothetical protein